MFGDFKYRDYLVRPDVLERKHDRRIKWYGVVVIVRERKKCTLSFEDRLFDWPAGARRHAVQRARQLIDAYLAGDSSALVSSPTIPRSRPAPDYPPGGFDDPITQF